MCIRDRINCKLINRLILLYGKHCGDRSQRLYLRLCIRALCRRLGVCRIDIDNLLIFTGRKTKLRRNGEGSCAARLNFQSGKDVYKRQY